MSLPRKDAHVHIDHDWHAIIEVLAESDGITLTKWIEIAAVEKAGRSVHKASLVMRRIEESGASGILKDLTGKDAE